MREEVNLQENRAKWTFFPTRHDIDALNTIKLSGPSSRHLAAPPCPVHTTNTTF
jgi:hypothetical protein